MDWKCFILFNVNGFAKKSDWDQWCEFSDQMCPNWTTVNPRDFYVWTFIGGLDR